MPTSSQGTNLVAGATKISIKASATRNTSKLDSSTLSISHGGDRTYEDGLTDLGPNGTGVIVTVSASGYGTKPAVGSTITALGETCKCMESSDEASVGELAAWSASYTSDYPQ
jgi:hypothetical protein